MLIRAIIIVVISCVAFCACNNEERVIREIKELSGREIIFPSGYVSLSCDKSLSIDSLLMQNIKIVSYIDDLPCTECGVRMLHSWIDDICDIDPKVSYIIVVQTQQKKSLFESIDSMQLARPLMYYDTPVFGDINNLDVLARNKTFLLNRDNKIVLVGEPWNNEKLSKLYSQAIDSLREKYARDIHGQ